VLAQLIFLLKVQRMVRKPLQARYFKKTECYVARVNVFLIVVALAAGMVGCDSSPIEIEDWYDLDAIRHDMGGYYLLMNDIDSTTAGYEELAGKTANGGKGWQPIGNSDSRFVGKFDGQGHVIRDVFVNRPDEAPGGLFGAVDKRGVIQNVKVMNANVTSQWLVGVLVGGNWGSVKDCYSTGIVTGDDYVGGLVGGNAGEVSNAYCTASVSGYRDIGGLVGSNDWGGAMNTCYFTGNVTGEWAVGGLSGSNLGGTIGYCYSTGNVSGTDYVGSLVGDNQGSVIDCYSIGDVTGDWHIGGLVGYNQGSVNNCYSTGIVTGDWHVGGLVGNNEGSISNSFWDTQTSTQASSDGGTAKTTSEMKNITTFTQSNWNIIAVAPSATDPSYIWNIVDGQTYPFLSRSSF
jgi:hypothetical protein